MRTCVPLLLDAVPLHTTSCRPLTIVNRKKKRVNLLNCSFLAFQSPIVRHTNKLKQKDSLDVVIIFVCICVVRTAAVRSCDCGMFPQKLHEWTFVKTPVLTLSGAQLKPCKTKH